MQVKARCGGAMARHDFDRSSKWLVENQGAGLLYVGGERSVTRCRALQAEVVQPARLPDGLLEVRRSGQKGESLVLVEVATYPEKRVVQQMTSGLALVRQARGVLPAGLVLVLRERGRYQVPQQHTERSAAGWSEATYRWRVVELWKQSAEKLLEAPEVGVVPLVPLADFEGAPESLLRRCRERLDREGGAQRANLLAVTQVLARLRFPQEELLNILGGSRVMQESPLIRDLIEETSRETKREDILVVLRARFKEVGEEIVTGLHAIRKARQLDPLVEQAGACDTLEAFQEALQKALPATPPKKKRQSK
jgi:predicted transposase YdaD